MHSLRPHAGLLLLAVLPFGSVLAAHAQSQGYGGGAVTVVTQTNSIRENPGGTTWGGSLLLGMSLSPRLSAEFEPLFVGSLEGQHTYLPNRTSTARVITRRRDTFFTFQFRARTGFLEPVVGVSYLHGRGSRHATIIDTGRPYFEDRHTRHGLAVGGGIDAGVKLTSHFFFVPTFRAFVVARSSFRNIDRIPGRRFVFRYGAGARVVF